MKQNEIQCLISLGFTDSGLYKRSVWVKVQRVMDFLANRNLIARADGSVKYATLDGRYPSQSDIASWARAYMTSPLSSHIEEMKKLSKELNIPLNSGRLLSEYTNHKIA